MRRDTVVGAFALILGAAYSLLTLQIPRATVGSPVAPLVFPGMIGAFMIVLGIGVLVVDRRKAAHFPEKKGEAKDPGYWKRVAGTIVLCGLYGLAFDHFGYILSTLPFLLALLTLVNGSGRWKANIVITVVFTLALWVIFVKGFNITLPTWTQGGIL